PEVASGTVVIFGGGNAAFNAASLALAMGCRVTIIELKKDRRDWLAKQFTGEALTLLPSTPENLAAAIKTADVFISTILIPGAKPPKLVT
ncbi:alanine dehydrogenase, partial [Mycobacterium kansasii]